VTMKNAVFWDMAPCRICVNRRFGGTYRFNLQGSRLLATCSRWFLVRGYFYPENGGDTFLRNVGSHKITRRHILLATCTRWFLARGIFYLEDGSDTFLRNVVSHKIYTAPHPRIRHYITHIILYTSRPLFFLYRPFLSFNRNLCQFPLSFILKRFFPSQIDCVVQRCSQ
jgi:hypothetical protein